MTAASGTSLALFFPKMARVNFEVPDILKKHPLHAAYSNMQTSESKSQADRTAGRRGTTSRLPASGPTDAQEDNGAHSVAEPWPHLPRA
ncbi:hypothetical protein CapIbe_014677 [Capra ibex]